MARELAGPHITSIGLDSIEAWETRGNHYRLVEARSCAIALALHRNEIGAAALVAANRSKFLKEARMRVDADRRKILSGGLGFSALWLAGCADDAACPEGSSPIEIVMTEEVVYWEGSAEVGVGPRGGIKGSIKVPTTVVRRELTCQPSPPRKSPSDPLLLDLRSLGLSATTWFRLNIETPSFVHLLDSLARLNVAATLMNGSVIPAAFDLVRGADGFRLANPSAVDYWAMTTGRNMMHGVWSVSPLRTEATAADQGLISTAFGLGDMTIGRQAQFQFGVGGRREFELAY